jgi:branched-chain amino acid transport system substrate-binding protein
MVPTTGSEATYGKDMENSFNLAVDQINAAEELAGRILKRYCRRCL